MEVDRDTHIGDYAALQSLTEVGLGSFLHALHIPFAGHFLSINQAVLLTFACKKTDSTKTAIKTSLAISNIAALLKSLSPMGKRLTPMLAISAQGFLYSLGFVLGRNILGVSLGIFLLSIWGFVQPLLLAYFIFGEKLFLAIEKLWMDLSNLLSIDQTYGIWILVSVVLIKIVVGILIGIYVWRSKSEFETRYLNKIRNIKVITPNKKKQNPFIGALKDSLSPWVLVSLTLSVSFMWVSEGSTYFELWLYSLRAFALAWLFFWGLRSYPMSWAKQLLYKYPAAKRAIDQVFNFKSRK
ncbi:MAG: hypothetical protein KDD37_05850 [Bdellovibrionales bacterium]|nr:hypothetical protein [Bdellovibrionales bacterium]